METPGTAHRRFLFGHAERFKLFHRRELMFFGRVRVTQHHLNSRMTEHRCERNQINAGHRSARRPGIMKIVESEAPNRALVCF